MIKTLFYLVFGMLFGIVLTKAEVISWYRIYEMFHFDSFHMYGIIGSAIGIGIILVQFVKSRGLRSFDGNVINIPDKEMGITRYLAGGTIFGLGWALSGACPGPKYILVGNGYEVMLVVILAAIAGTFVYGALRDKLPH